VKEGNSTISTNDGDMVVEDGGDSVDDPLVVSSSTITSWLSHRSSSSTVLVRVLLLSPLCTVGSYL